MMVWIINGASADHTCKERKKPQQNFVKYSTGQIVHMQIFNLNKNEWMHLCKPAQPHFTSAKQYEDSNKNFHMSYWQQPNPLSQTTLTLYSQGTQWACYIGWDHMGGDQR